MKAKPTNNKPEKVKKVPKKGRSVKLDPTLWDDLDALAEADKRSTNNLIEVALFEFRDKLLKVKKKSAEPVPDLYRNK